MTPRAPQHLAPETRRWWRSVVETWVLESHHVKILTVAGESWDRKEEARRILAEEGPVITDRFGQQVPHPAIKVEKDSMGSFLRAVKALGLDIEPPRPGPGRPPRSEGGW